MTVQDFVKNLSGIPSEDSIQLLGKMELNQDFIYEYINKYVFKLKSTIYTEYNNELINLVQNYDGSAVKIGMITFDIEPFEDENYYYFGLFEIDFLVINKKTGEILLVDYDDINHVIFHCAINGNNFLDAILMAAKFLERLPFDDHLRHDQVQIYNIAETCSHLAGGNKYLDFYKTVVGCDN